VAERLQHEAERARESAEAANRAKSEFLSTMSHELRTPLNAIGGYAELLDMGIRGPVTAEQREDLARIKRSSHHLLSLINDILNFARLEAGQVDFRIADVAVGALVGDVEGLVAPQLAAKSLVYEQRCEGPTVVRADPERLRQILLNLLTNAVKFTAAGGRIRLLCDAVGATARIRVEDTGRGIPADQLAEIFEPFVQVDRHLTHQSQQGVGLGLAISRDLARRMGGELAAESTVAVGSTFTLTLPAG
jgi:signal transduction histidine kinase